MGYDIFCNPDFEETPDGATFIITNSLIVEKVIPLGLGEFSRKYEFWLFKKIEHG